MLMNHPYATPFMQRQRIVPIIGLPPGEPPGNPPVLTGLQKDLRFSWWAPYTGIDGSASPGMGDVSGALGLTPINAMNGGSVTTSFDAKWQFSADLDGATDYVGATDEADLRYTGASPVTFSAWVKCESVLPLSGIKPILSKMTGALQGEYQLYLIGITGGRIAARFEIIVGDKVYFVQGFSNVPVNEWALIVASFDPASRRTSILVNNSGSQSSAFLAAVYDSSGDFEIGARTATGSYFKGKIDEVTRWNRLLTVEEFNWLYSNDLWNGVIPVVRLASGDPLDYPVSQSDLPADPSNLEAYDNAGEVELTWTDNAIGLGNVEVWRSIDAGGFELVTRLSNNVGLYLDAGTDTALHAYEYKIRTTNYNGASGYSATVAIGTGGGAPGLTTDEGTVSTDDGTLTTDES